MILARRVDAKAKKIVFLAPGSDEFVEYDERAETFCGSASLVGMIRNGAHFSCRTLCALTGCAKKCDAHGTEVCRYKFDAGDFVDLGAVNCASSRDVIFTPAELRDLYESTSLLPPQSWYVASQNAPESYKQRAAAPAPQPERTLEAEYVAWIYYPESVGCPAPALRDIDLIMSQAGVDRETAIRSLRENIGDVVGAIMELTSDRDRDMSPLDVATPVDYVVQHTGVADWRASFALDLHGGDADAAIEEIMAAREWLPEECDRVAYGDFLEEMRPDLVAWNIEYKGRKDRRFGRAARGFVLEEVNGALFALVPRGVDWRRDDVLFR